MSTEKLSPGQDKSCAYYTWIGRTACMQVTPCLSRILCGRLASQGPQLWASSSWLGQLTQWRGFLWNWVAMHLSLCLMMPTLRLLLPEWWPLPSEMQARHVFVPTECLFRYLLLACEESRNLLTFPSFLIFYLTEIIGRGLLMMHACPFLFSDHLQRASEFRGRERCILL